MRPAGPPRLSPGYGSHSNNNVSTYIQAACEPAGGWLSGVRHAFCGDEVLFAQKRGGAGYGTRRLVS